MIISARAVRSGRVAHLCASCNTWISKGEPKLRLFGMAHYGDPPYTLYLCVPCAKRSRTGRDADKIADALLHLGTRR